MNFVLDLPNELWLTVFSYLNTVDLFQSFENINQRFNNLLYGNLQNLILPNDVTNPWLIRILPLITKPIQTLSCDECSLTFIWNHLHYFSQIQSVNLHGNDWTMSMKLFDQPLSLVLISSLKYLFSVTPWNVRLSAETLTRINSQTHVEYRERMSMIQSFTDEVNEDDLCPFVIRLSVQVVYSPILFRICTRARNLRHLQIHYNHFGFGDESAVPKFHLSIQRASLRILQITSRHNRNLNVFDKFVRWFDQSLEKFILDVDCIDSIDGNLLQSLCQPFVRLKRFRFFIENPIKNLEEYFQSFESQWWRRFPVYIQKKTNNLSIVATIPVLRAFDFENGFYNWLINGDLHSPRIEFNSKKIHFLNTKSQLIDLKDLDFIDRIFSSFDQVLSFNYPYLHTPDLVYQLVILLFHHSHQLISHLFS